MILLRIILISSLGLFVYFVYNIEDMQGPTLYKMLALIFGLGVLMLCQVYYDEYVKKETKDKIITLSWYIPLAMLQGILFILSLKFIRNSKIFIDSDLIKNKEKITYLYKKKGLNYAKFKLVSKRLNLYCYDDISHIIESKDKMYVFYKSKVDQKRLILLKNKDIFKESLEKINRFSL